MVVAEVFLFDYNKYQNQVLPHFSELVSNGKIDSWLKQLELDEWNAMAKGNPYLKFASKLEGLEISTESYRRFLDDDLGLKPDFFSKVPSFQNEVIADLFHFAILRQCFGQGHFVGRMSFTWNLLNYCKRKGWLNNPSLHDLLLALRYRGCYIASSEFGDGIKAWLNPKKAGNWLNVWRIFHYQNTNHPLKLLSNSANLLQMEQKNILILSLILTHFYFPLLEHLQR